VCEDVGPHRWEVELVRVSARQGPVRPPRGEPKERERRQSDEVFERLDDDERAGRRHRYDDPGAGPSHAAPTRGDREFKDFRRRLEAVLQGVPEGMWTRI